MRGVFTHGGTHYCILPKSSADTESHIPGGPPIGKAARDDGKRLLTVTKTPIPNTFAFKEEDLWIPEERLVSIKGWPVYPFAQSLFTLPAAVVDEIFASTNIVRKDNSPDAIVTVNWHGVPLTRHFKVAELGVGIAAWPPRVIPDWDNFFLMFAPGNQALINQGGAALFEEREPCVYGFADGQGDTAIVEAETRLIGSRMGAFCRMAVPPRWISFRSRSERSVTYGILPLQFGERGELRMPRSGDRRKSAFAKTFGPSQTKGNRSTWIAVDFGTSNTAIAVYDGNQVDSLVFDEGSRAVNLTGSVGLDPATSPEFGVRFFPLSFEYSNPLSTILIEFDETGQPFKDSDLFPKRAIPGIRLVDPGAIQDYARKGFLKQDFKWKDSEEGPIHQRAFLEHLAFAVAWQLRIQDEDRKRPAIKVVFTCPLAFNVKQTESLKRSVTSFQETLTASGFGPVEVQTVVSESLANLYYVRDRNPSGSQIQSERHVVIDIGGGTTDISIFTGKGDPILLDSLYIGGKDIAGSLLYFRSTSQDGWKPVAKVLGLDTKVSPQKNGDSKWTEMAQCLLINRMGTRDGDGISKLASEFSAENMQDLLGEVGALLVFVTTYAIRMAALARPEMDLPAASKIWVWYAGLGSRLFEMFPLGRGKMDRWKTAQGVLKRVALEFPETKQLDISFDKAYGKESVCRGALLSLLEADAPDPLDFATIWWADLLKVTPPIQWTHPFSAAAIQPLSDDERAAITTKELFGCFETAVRIVGQTTFGSEWTPDDDRMNVARSRFPENFARAVLDIKKQSSKSPKHPVLYVTTAMKTDLCELIEP